MSIFNDDIFQLGVGGGMAAPNNKNNESQKQQHHEQPSMKKTSSHKMVSVHKEVNDQKERQKQQQQRHVNRKRHHPYHKANKQTEGGVIKRVKLNPKLSSVESYVNNDDSVSRTEMCQEVQKKDTDSAATTRLTDFAYREVSAPSNRIKRGGGRRRGSAISHPTTNMGLVRVKPTEDQPQQQQALTLRSPSKSLSLRPMNKHPSNTKTNTNINNICKTFLGGEQCTNVACTKRHDIPREMATPICSFFQRFMCTKGDACPFLHIKVNSNAKICPNFSQFGYCRDVNCTMKHLRV
mmetsp:Transcript_33299/g.48958  ORF Transcript_33299/g.48958 Transcript_33299/m.48958 type:complete len:294 (+) Transcript_33299:3-884(+)